MLCTVTAILIPHDWIGLNTKCGILKSLLLEMWFLGTNELFKRKLVSGNNHEDWKIIEIFFLKS